MFSISDFTLSILETLSFAFCIASLVNVLMSFTDCEDLSASFPTSVATTEKPLPASPALEASIEALSANIVVCCAISSIRDEISAILPLFSDTSLANSTIFSVSSEPFFAVLDASKAASPVFFVLSSTNSRRSPDSRTFS